MRILTLVMLAGCSMYGARSERLHPVEPIHHGPEPVAEIKPSYNNDCVVDFHRNPVGVQRAPAVAAKHVRDGDTQLAIAVRKSDTARADMIVSGIEFYADALRDDPYDATATLRLALAYDQMFHKGCALALLHRLDALAQNPQISPDAHLRADDVVSNPVWFRGYRKEALAAINR